MTETILLFSLTQPLKWSCRCWYIIASYWSKIFLKPRNASQAGAQSGDQCGSSLRNKSKFKRCNCNAHSAIVHLADVTQAWETKIDNKFNRWAVRCAIAMLLCNCALVHLARWRISQKDCFTFFEKIMPNQVEKPERSWWKRAAR